MLRTRGETTGTVPRAKMPANLYLWFRRSAVVGYKKTVLMLLSMFFIMTFYISSWAKDTKSLIDQKQFSNFLTHFRLVKHVHLDFDNLIIGNIELFLPINNNYVIYDQMADSLYEIDPAQKSYHNIDIEEKLPGKHWSALGITACGETSYMSRFI